jgi:hypothetical protein
MRWKGDSREGVALFSYPDEYGEVVASGRTGPSHDAQYIICPSAGVVMKRTLVLPVMLVLLTASFGTTTDLDPHQQYETALALAERDQHMRAVHAARDAANGGLREGMMLAAELVRSTHPDEAIEWWERAATEGDVNAAYELARHAYARGDYLRSVALLEVAARAGIAGAQYLLSVHYRQALGRPANPEMAEYWLDRAAAQGYDIAVAEAGIRSRAGKV